MINNTYNGWRNRETWLVNLWYGDQGFADVDYIKELLEDMVDQLETVLKEKGADVTSD